jgi:hypothetical protein
MFWISVSELCSWVKETLGNTNVAATIEMYLLARGTVTMSSCVHGNNADLRTTVGTLKDGYVCNVPLPRVTRIQSAKFIAPSICNLAGTKPSRCILVGTPLPDYLPVSSWIPTLPKLGSILGFSQRVL